MATDYAGYLDFLQTFSKNNWVQNQLHMQKKPNFWTILEYGEKSTIKSYEIRLSRMFRWLFDPNANHGLGNYFAHQLFQFHNQANTSREAVNYPYVPGENPAIHVTSEEKHIDLLYKDFAAGIIVAIELKHYADEGKRKGISQLIHYEKELKKMIAKTPLEPYCFYLTPTGKPSTRSEVDPAVAAADPDALKFRWIPISYSTFITFIEAVETNLLQVDTNEYTADIRKLINDFKDDLQRSVDIITATANKAILNESMDQAYIKLTQSIAKKINKQETSAHLNKLRALNKDNQLELEAVLLILNDALNAQNHTPHVGVQILTRKIFNYLSAETAIPTAADKLETYGANAKYASIKQTIIQKDLPVEKVLITKDKGQGLFLFHQSLPYKIYMSGDAYGSFPNDGIQLIQIKKNGKVRKFPRLKGEMFVLDDKLIQSNKLKTASGEIMSFDTFIEDYLLDSIRHAIKQI